MHLFVFTPYPCEGPSNRYRVLQYLPYFRKTGIHVVVRPFLTSEFYKIVYKKGNRLKKAWMFFKATFQRLKDVNEARKADIIFIHRECYPLGPPFIERFLTHFGKPIIYDFDDAIYLPTAKNRLRNWIKWHSKIPKIISLSDHVIVCNDYLYQYAMKFNKQVTNIPTSIDTARFSCKKDWMAHQPIRIGWIGSHTTTKYLDRLIPVFKKLARQYDFELYVVGANKQLNIPGVNVVQKPWELQRELKDFQSLDIGVYPLVDDAWTVGKTGFKTVQYMAVGVPGVISDVGANTGIVQDGVNGFLVRTEEEWLDRLSRLIQDQGLRERIGRNGRKTVEEKYSVAVQLEHYHILFREVLRPRILHLISDLDIGGTEIMLTQLVGASDRDTYHLFVCSIKPFGIVADSIKAIGGIHLYSLDVHRKLDFTIYFRLYRILRKNRITILQTYLFFDNILGKVIGRLARIPIIISGQRYLCGEEPFWRIFLEKMTSKLTDCIVANSRAAKLSLIAHVRNPERIQVIYNGKDYSLCNAAFQNVNRRFVLLKQHNLLVGIVARLDKVKGHTYFLDAARRVLNTIPNVHFLIVGDGQLRQSLQHYANELQIQDNVHFLGNQKNVLPIIALFDVSVLSSIAESFPGAILEYMGMGKPVVATRVGGVPEMIVDGETGYLVPPKDPYTLAAKIVDLLRDAQKRKRFGENAKKRAQSQFSYGDMVRAYERLYDMLLRKKQIPHGGLMVAGGNRPSGRVRKLHKQ